MRCTEYGKTIPEIGLYAPSWVCGREQPCPYHEKETEDDD